MNSIDLFGWENLLDGHPWFDGTGSFPLPAYSEFMPPPRVGRSPYGSFDELFLENDVYGWRVSEVEQEYELNSGLKNIARQIMEQLIDLGRGRPAHHIAGYLRRNLENNPYWPAELAEHAGRFLHERFVVLLPLAFSKTQDDQGRVRWTFFGGSEQGPERAFWKSFFSAPGQEIPSGESVGFISRLLHAAYGERTDDESQLRQIGFRVLSSPNDSSLPYRNSEPLPNWTRPFLVDEGSMFDGVKYLLTFTPFENLPPAVRTKYLDGKLHLLPFPGSLLFWGIPVYRRLQRGLPLAMQLPLQRLVARHDGPGGIRIPQSGWLHEPRQDRVVAELKEELLLNTYRRTNRWNKVQRYEDAAAKSAKVDKVAQTLFSTSLDAIDLYDKPMARNCQLWRETGEVLLDGPNASRNEIEKAAAELTEGGIFRYRFQFPAMRVGVHEVYWHRPLVAFLPDHGRGIELFESQPSGYLTAYRSDAMDIDHPVELFPRLLRREKYLSALSYFDAAHDHYEHQTALNIVTLFDMREQLKKKSLPRSFARHLIRTAKAETLDDWLSALPKRATRREEGERVRLEIQSLLEADEPLPDAITFQHTATRAYEEAYWNDILYLSHGVYLNKDNADVVQDPPTLQHVDHNHRDLEALSDYLISRHRHAILDAGMDGRAVVGELPFRWQTDFDYRQFGGWEMSHDGRDAERNVLVVIPGKSRSEAVILADHYDTAYMEDVYDRTRGGSGARLAAAGADDNDSATATLLQAAPVFLSLSREGKLERDVWLLHLTGEEFPADSMGARNFCRSVVEKTLKLHTGDGRTVGLSSVRLSGLFVMDMIAHNRENGRDIFQISPGKSAESLRIAYQAHLANMIWNTKASEWNRGVERRGRGRGKRSRDGVSIPDVALHPQLEGQVRTFDDPQSSLYNTDGQIFSDIGLPVVLFMENYDINRTGYHDTKDTMENIDLDYGSAVSAIAIETVARVAALPNL